jgi:phosphatidyl-myo-inositol dimannoside synthase
MRLMMIASNFPPVLGGIQTYAHQLAHQLARRSELLLVAPRSPGGAEFDAADGDQFEHLRLPSLGDDLALSGIPPLALLLQRCSFDAAFATHWAPGFALQRAARLAGRRLPVFIAAHGKELIHRPFARLAPVQAVYSRIRARALRDAAGFFPVSERTAQLLAESGVERERITVVHNGVDPELYRPRDASALRAKLLGGTLSPTPTSTQRAPNLAAQAAAGRDAAGPLLLSVARLVSRKGIDTVLRALPRVIEQRPGLRYVIAGQGPDRRRLDALVSELGLGANVVFSTDERAALVDYYNACDLFVLPTREEPTDIEGFGLVFLEAGACEKPVIGARAGGVVDAIDDGVTGRLVPPDDPAALSAAILELLSDPLRARAFGRAARARIMRQGTWAHAADLISGALRRHLSSRDSHACAAS